MTTQRDIRSGTTYTTTWTYNAQDQVRQMQYPTGETVVMTYTLQGLPQQLAPYVTNAEYNVAGQMTTLIQANTVTTTYAYHGLTQRPTQVQSTLGTTDLLKLGYSYDPVGNVTQIVDGVRTQTATFSYDTLDRLKTATIPSVYSQTLSYDSVGNITQRTDNGNATNYTYGDSAHKHAVTAAGSKSYVYDANGNMTNRAGDALSYDNENHLASVTASNWVSTTLYAYDADGQRARKRVVSNGVTTTTYYVGNWFEVTEGVTTTYYYLGGQRVAMRRVAAGQQDQVTYLHSDHLGSTSAWSGSNSGSQAYYPFGLVRTTTGAQPTDFGYTGQRLDKSTAQNTAGTDGLLYYGARYYDSSMGRWGQPDTIVSDWYSPQNLNRYSYVLNNPVKYNDPNGHDVGCGGRNASKCPNRPRIVPRSEWGALPPNMNSSEGAYDPIRNLGGYAPYSALEPDKSLADVYDSAVIHHEGNDQTYDPKAVQLKHVQKGWADIGYHYIVRPDGTVYEGRDIGVRGAHVEGKNTGKIGILLLGDFQPGSEVSILGITIPIPWDPTGDNTPTLEQVKGTIDLMHWLDNTYGIDTVKAHRDLNPTECPGDNAMPYMPLFDEAAQEDWK